MIYAKNNMMTIDCSPEIVLQSLICDIWDVYTRITSRCRRLRVLANFGSRILTRHCCQTKTCYLWSFSHFLLCDPCASRMPSSMAQLLERVENRMDMSRSFSSSACPDMPFWILYSLTISRISSRLRFCFTYESEGITWSSNPLTQKSAESILQKSPPTASLLRNTPLHSLTNLV